MVLQQDTASATAPSRPLEPTPPPVAGSPAWPTAAEEPAAPLVEVAASFWAFALPRIGPLCAHAASEDSSPSSLS
eukprot:7010363-Prymnesium_polylepis.1